MANQKTFTTEEWRHVVILCPHCATRVTLDMAEFVPRIPPRSDEKRKAFTPAHCPACGNGYDTALSELNEFQHAYLALAKLKGVVAFLVETPED